MNTPSDREIASLRRLAALLEEIPEEYYPAILACCKALQAKEKPAAPSTEREL